MSNSISHALSLDDISSADENDEQIELYTQNVPEPPCILLRWRFLVQAQFYTHNGYILQLPPHDDDEDDDEDEDEDEVNNIVCSIQPITHP
jgi:hypothetical protein